MSAAEPERVLAGLALLLLLGWLAWTDWRTRRLPDRVVLPALWAGLLLAATLSPLASAESAVLGAAAGYLVLRGLDGAWRLSRGEEAFGGGDPKTLAMIGAWLGWQALPAVLLLAFLSGTLAVLPGLLSGRISPGREVPFGPALALGAAASLLGGASLDAWLFGA